MTCLTILNRLQSLRVARYKKMFFAKLQILIHLGLNITNSAQGVNSKKLDHFMFIFQNVVTYKMTKLFEVYALRRVVKIEFSLLSAVCPRHGKKEL